MAKFYTKYPIANQIHNSKIPSFQYKFEIFQLKFEMTLIPIKGIKALGNKKFYRTILQFNLEIPKYQYIVKIIHKRIFLL